MLEHPPLVSVIVRTKNRPESLTRCLISISEQHYRPLEVVIINDGGEDISAITTALGNRCSPPLDLKINQLQSNVGRTQAANLGLEMATGEYISFLDDDDYWLPQHIALLTETLQNRQPGEPSAAYSATKAVLIKKPNNTEEEREIKTYNTPFDREQLLYCNFLPILSVLFHRSVIDKGIRFDNNFDLFEDWDFWLQVSEKLNFTNHSEATCVYRLHEQASGVHNQSHADSAYLSIYQKWHSKRTPIQQYELLVKSHHWHNRAIDDLQRANNEQNTKIGKQHSFALETIENKDANIRSLENAHTLALKTIAEKDKDIEKLSKLHLHALDIIAEKDRNSEELADNYALAIRTIQEKDIQAEALNSRLHEQSERLQQQKGTLQDKEQQLNELRLKLKTPLRTALRSLLPKR